MTEKTTTPSKRRLVKFDPTFNTGTLVLVGTVIASAVLFTVTIKGELMAQKVEIEANKIAAERADAKQEDALKELKSDVRELSRTVNDINQGVAILRGRTGDPGVKR